VHSTAVPWQDIVISNGQIKVLNFDWRYEGALLAYGDLPDSVIKLGLLSGLWFPVSSFILDDLDVD
jgi:hypothetical protein